MKNRSAIPAGNFDSSSSQKGLDSSVSSRGAGEDPTTRTGSEPVKLRPESTKDTILTISDSEVSDPAGIAENRDKYQFKQNLEFLWPRIYREFEISKAAGIDSFKVRENPKIALRNS